MKSLSKKNNPVIGITLDWEDSLSYSDMSPWYALRTNYISSIAKHDATVITLPYEMNSIDAYIDLIDGLVITGGDYDLAPEFYGEKTEVVTRVIKNNRTSFEMNLIKAALARNKPILAICAGQQLLSCMYGGKLHQDIKAYNPNSLEHEQRVLGIHMSKTSHKISIKPNTLLYNIVKKEEMEVNSSHHQAVKSVGSTTIISAVSSEDGIIEAIEMPEYSFVLGVEWHPEYEATSEDTLIIRAFIKAVKEND
jgi:putative glutamine amidotransferase